MMKTVVADRVVLKKLFGKPMRVLLAVWVIDRDGATFFQGEATTDDAKAFHGGSSSNVQEELRQFVDYEMLMRTEDGRKVYYTQLENPLWEAFASIEKAVSAYKSADTV